MKKTLCLGAALLSLSWGQVSRAHPIAAETDSQTLLKTEAPASTDEPLADPVMPVPSSPELPASESVEPPSLTESEVPPAAREPMEDPATPDVAAQEMPEVELINRGEKPRKKLRFKAQVGEKLRSRMIMSSETSISLNGEPFPNFPIPDVEVVSESEILKVERDGTTHIKFRYLEPVVRTVKDDPFSAMFESVFKKQFEVLSNSSITYVFDKRGRVLKTDIDTDVDSADPSFAFLKQLMQSSQQSSGIFPKKSVGVGAEWSSFQTVALQGASLKPNVVYKLLELQDDQVKIGTQVEIDDPKFMEQIASMMSLTKDVPMNVEAFKVSVQGDMTMGNSQFMATNMDLITDGNAIITIPAGEKEMRLEVNIKSTLKMSPEDIVEAE